MLRRWKSEVYTHEDIVIQRYDWLLNWSMKLTGHNREEAEDLVHDAFVEFTLSAPDLGSIQNLEGYLYGMLRNIHVSRVRRAIRIERKSASLLEYDSAEIWLRSVHIDSLIHARELLRSVCDYACERKETSKAGSILILRFFHAYYPGEIARIALCPRRAVDDWMLIARKEARRHIEQVTTAPTMERLPGASAHSGDDFIDTLRRLIFESKKGNCLSEREIQDRYHRPDQQALDRRQLAHISACPDCLERINRNLDLPPLSDRFPTDTLGNDIGGAESSPGRKPVAETRVKSCRRLARAVYHHEPRELTIMVNGFFTASETLQARLSERILALHPTERLSVVEAFSEQGVRLLGLNVEPPPDGLLEQAARVDLSEGRYLALSIGFKGSNPSLKSSYYDPNCIEPTLLERVSEASRPNPRLSPNRSSVLSEQVSPLLPPGRPRSEEVPRGRSLFRMLLDALSAGMRPASVTAALAIIMAAIIIALHLKTTTVSAAELLRQAVAADDKLTRQPDTVLHRRLVLEERTMAPPVFVIRRQLDIWTNPAAGLKGCRVYDDNGLLLAGEWVNSAGVHSIYRRDTSTQLQDSGETDLSAVIDSGEIWRIGLSARDFLSLAGQAGTGTVVQGTDSYTINYVFGDSKLARASLVLNKSGLRAFEETLVVRRPQGLIQYRFSERSHETVPLGETKTSVFYPDPWIQGARIQSPAPPDLPGANSLPRSAPEGLPDAAFYSLKLDAVYLLHRAGACLAGQTTFARTESGSLRIQVFVDSDRRKSQVIAALGSLGGTPGVELEVSTFAEAAARRPSLPADNLIVKRIEVDRDRIPAYPDLARYFSVSHTNSDPGSGDGAATESKIERFAAGILKRSRLALLHAWALKRHQEDADGSPVHQQSLLAEMAADHLRVIRDETARLSAELVPIFGATEVGEAADQPGNEDFVGPIDRLYEMVLSNENAISMSLTVNASGAIMPECPIKTAGFWRSLRGAEKLAASMLGINGQKRRVNQSGG
jgi:DNA-directed RNA polymerase specialized sigma24 family protein